MTRRPASPRRGTWSDETRCHGALQVASLTVDLPHGQRLLGPLQFEVAPGEVLVLRGASGSGKSTILNWLAGARAPALQISGSAWLGERRIDHLPAEKRHLGLMLQQDYLFPHMSVGDNLLFGLRGGTRRERRQRVSDALAAAGLDGMASRTPASLSGGQRSRASLLRTLLSSPGALLLDEPFSSLDRDRRAQVRELVWCSAAHLPVLLVTHDVEDIPSHARVVDLSNPTDT
ncbi:MAG: sulfate ABC transporter ATP-binding protein [Gammaproteobacteria bacterium]|nr:MAG: sulfate ABC transporter ATP-binding protein [Gammaproteobacteria bacterium]